MSLNGTRGRNPFGGNGASGTEMRFFDRRSDQLAERLLSDPESVYPEDGHDETVLFVRALPAAVPVLPDPAFEAEMIPALAGAARSASLEASRVATTTSRRLRPSRRQRWRLRLAVLAAAVAVLPVLMAGLAYAGVDLPDAVDDAFESAGVDLPNQSQAEATCRAGGEGKGDRGKSESASKNAAGTQGSDEASPRVAPAPTARPTRASPSMPVPRPRRPGMGPRRPARAEFRPATPACRPAAAATAPPARRLSPARRPTLGLRPSPRVRGTPPGQGSTPPGEG